MHLLWRWRRGRRPVAGRGLCQAARRGYHAIQHQGGIAGAGQAIVRINLLRDDARGYGKWLSRQNSGDVATRNTIVVTMPAHTLDDIMPDRCSARNTDDAVIHRAVIGITRPDTHHHV